MLTDLAKTYSLSIRPRHQMVDKSDPQARRGDLEVQIETRVHPRFGRAIAS
jgi:hypothetical protein